MTRSILLFSLLFISFTSQALACATGCNMFDVSTSGVLPGKPGSTVWIEHSYANQDDNRRATSGADPSLNEHKKIRSNTYQIGGQYMFDREWGVKANVPWLQRNVVNTDDVTGEELSFEHGGLGDVRLMGIYSGFSPDMTTGLNFGVKLPTGQTDDEGFDRDAALGTGSTDILFGGYHIGQFADPMYGWFVNGLWSQPVLTRGDFRPGAEANVTTGAYYKGWDVGHHVMVKPVMQLIGGHHAPDSGSESHSDDSGYTRVSVSPGIELSHDNVKLYTEIAVPVYNYVRGYQVVEPFTAKTVLSYNF